MAKEEMYDENYIYEGEDEVIEDEEDDMFIDDDAANPPVPAPKVTSPESDITETPAVSKAVDVDSPTDAEQKDRAGVLPAPDHNEEETNSFKGMTVRDYIEYKHTEYIRTYGNDENGWNKLRSQINSAVQLGISFAHIEIFAKGSFDYETREIIKYALYDGQLSPNYLRELLSGGYSAETIRTKIDDKKSGIKLSEELSTPLRILSDSITSYKQDIDNYKEITDRQISKYKDRLQAAESERDQLREQLASERKTYESKLKSYSEREQMERERKDFEARVEKAAQEKAAQMQLARDAENDRLMMERQKLEAEIRQEQQTKKKRFWNKNKKAEEKPVPRKAMSTLEKIPAGFDMTAYIMSAGLSAGQMDVISLAVRSGVDDSLIKALIDQQLPAAQMKQMLAVILARGHQGSAVSESDVRYE